MLDVVSGRTRGLVLIRVDGNETMGMGHVMRCCSLARELRARAPVDVEFVTKADAASVNYIRRSGLPVHPLPVERSWEDERQAVVEFIRHRGADAVITDLPWIELAYLAGLKSTRAVVAVIDEWGDKEIRADIVINGTAVPAWHRYVVDDSVDRFLGPQYALLDPSFVEAHLFQRDIRENPTGILIALGGDDPFHLTVRVMESLEGVAGCLDVTTVIGPAFIDEESIRRAAEISRHRYTLLRNARNMAELMCRADLAITGGGLTALEVACTGTPAIIICEVDHQVVTASVLENMGAAVNLGLGVEVPHDSIAGEVRALLADRNRRFRLSQSGKALLDGRGTERVAEILASALMFRRNR